MNIHKPIGARIGLHVVNAVCGFELVGINTGLVPPLTRIVHWARRHPNPIVRRGVPAVATIGLLWAWHHLVIEQLEAPIVVIVKGPVESSPLGSFDGYGVQS